MPAKRGRPYKRKDPSVKERTAYLQSLPAEVLGLIASFLLPTFPSPSEGFPSPYDRPDTSARNIRASGRSELYGGIPAGMKDLCAFARTCKQVEKGVHLVVGKIGGTGKEEGSVAGGMK